MYANLSDHEEWLGKQVVDIAYTMHKVLGPGLLESIYERAFCYELTLRSIPFVTQQKVPLIYKDMEFEDGLRLDILVDNLVIIELKAEENFHPVWGSQIIKLSEIDRK